MHTVHLRINDAATGQPTPVRLRILGPDGQPCVPFGRLGHFAVEPEVDVGGHVQLGSQRLVYVDGTCEVCLPAGTITLEISKGPEYESVVRQITLGAGQISLRTALQRWIDLRAEGWFSGDTRVLALCPQAALLEAAAEDVAVVHLLARDRPPCAGRPGALANLLAFSGDRSALDRPGHLVSVNTLNSHPLLGTLSLLNCHRVVYPLRFGGPDCRDTWSLADWCDQCHRKKGLVIWPDLPRLTEDQPQGEALGCLILGKIDAYEISFFPDPEPEVLGHWYRLLSCGVRVPLVGGSGKDSNAVALGSVRTYAQVGPLEGNWNAQALLPVWIEAVRAGRTFVTNGPLLTLTVDGQGPGTRLHVPPEGRRVQIRVEARSSVAFDQVELLLNGAILASKTASGNRQAAVLETETTLTQGAWLAARCWSAERLADGQCVYAHTSPVYFYSSGQPMRPEADTAPPLGQVLERTEKWARHRAICETEAQREHLLGNLVAARQELVQRSAGGCS